jgi:uncharacterized protein (TIGR02145 family)
MMPDGQGTWTEEIGVGYCDTVAGNRANSAECQQNYGRNSSGTAIGGRGICPPNWHVPTDFELGVMLDVMESGGGITHQSTTVTNGYIGIDAGRHGKASCSGTPSDTNPVWNSGAGTDDFNFHALASDDRNWNGKQDVSRGLASVFWSSSAYSSSKAWRRLFDVTAVVFRVADNRLNGNSVRCIRDE